MQYRVLVTGSRGWPDPAAVRDTLNELLAAHGQLIVVHGACPTGADAHAAAWIHQAGDRPVLEERHPADWRRHGRRAGYLRNAHMVSLGAHVCLAFVTTCKRPSCTDRPPHGSHGATHCADLAEQTGIPVRRWPR